MRSPTIYKISPHPSLLKREIKERRFHLDRRRRVKACYPPFFRHTIRYRAETVQCVGSSARSALKRVCRQLTLALAK
jgi:hypothetical protein